MDLGKDNSANLSVFLLHLKVPENLSRLAFGGAMTALTKIIPPEFPLYMNLLCCATYI